MLTNSVQKVDVDFRIRIFTNLLWDVHTNTSLLLRAQSLGYSNVCPCGPCHYGLIQRSESAINEFLPRVEIAHNLPAICYSVRNAMHKRKATSAGFLQTRYGSCPSSMANIPGW